MQNEPEGIMRHNDGHYDSGNERHTLINLNEVRKFLYVERTEFWDGIDSCIAGIPAHFGKGNLGNLRIEKI
jgi:hypothetical protein